MLKFMREFTNNDGGCLIFDGTSFTSRTNANPYVQKGYNTNHKGAKQIRIIYAYNRTSKLPVYFMVTPGNITDMTAFKEAFAEINHENTAIILDKGHLSKQNIKSLEGYDFIIPVRKDTAMVSADVKAFYYRDKVLHNVFNYNKRNIHYIEVPQEKFKGCRLIVYYDGERRTQLLASHFIKNDYSSKLIIGEEAHELYEETLSLGVTILLTSMDSSASQIYYDYKTRWDIEGMFDTHKNTLSFNMHYETQSEQAQGWAFVEFIALLMYYKINAKLLESGEIKNITVKDLLLKLSTVTQSKTSGKWEICNLTSNIKSLLLLFNVTLEPLK